ncbi:hypothetical protein AC792_03210 [Arthrobacter sp. RIT-PI-e]|uniref:hypothetical protein n=1 Tax=Arthrobacter sp. RIT-PI-e TaxID=1681197 RepID=UPI00067605D0|nr:hypothetical protein [Arthrobacter sp. RIT-PI-e]KNC20006.1 hypothetical protein AC792_03210 [Arthrobacter sp. RIT-PI-e]
MTRIVLWVLTASTRYSYLLVRSLFLLPLLVLPMRRRVRHQVAGALAVGLWFLGAFVIVVTADAPSWGLLLVGGVLVLVIGWTVCMERRHVLAYR